MADEGTQRMNNPEFNAEGQDGHNPQVNVEEHSTRNNNHVTNSGLLEACQILQQVVDEMRQMGENPPVDTNVQEVVNEGNVRGAQQVEQPQEMLNTAQMLGDGGLTLDRFVKLIKNPFFGKPDPTLVEEWLAKAEKILDTARISNSQRLVYTSFMLEDSAERWWKLLSMKWEREGVPSTWENFKREFTNKYVPAVTQEKKEVNFIKFEQQNMSVSVYKSQFTDLARFCPHLVDTEERKVRKFVKGLNKDLRDKLIPLQLQTYMAVVDRALAIENDLEEQKNVDTEPFRAPSYGGQGNRNSGNVNPGGRGRGNTWQGNFQRALQGRNHNFYGNGQGRGRGNQMSGYTGSQASFAASSPGDNNKRRNQTEISSTQPSKQARIGERFHRLCPSATILIPVNTPTNPFQ
ncbi:hypothetical protein RJ640_001752 [Escallonia rubra]|uniref:Retrotransposon gag domain-containing protein n=1 Tax=Escallonia rubra TaxID=112253 RepID=A0AA88R488_9ASTE|nr:hypothetical protein RJ640_001752 [Escallonia rubra]